MSWDGMYPSHNCKKCGKSLNADGGHPAELYAGTYTGLCYSCERIGPYAEKRCFDGAILMNHPPHCPSWRRDREHYWAYPDCPNCKGIGCIRISRPFPQGGPYNQQCKICRERYYNNPLRKEHNAFLEKWRTYFYQKSEKAFQKALKKHLGTKNTREVDSDPEKKQKAKELAKTYLEKYRIATTNLHAFCERRYPAVYDIEVLVKES